MFLQLRHGTNADLFKSGLKPFELAYNDDEQALMIGSGLGSTPLPIGLPSLAFNEQAGTNYVVQASDENKVIAMTSAVANTITLDAGVMSGNVEFGVAQMGAGATTIVAGAGVTINAIGTLQVRGQYAMVGLVQISQDNWLLIGNMN